jgi:hypothetical protein
MAHRKKPKRHPARSKASTSKKRSLAAKKAWETRRAKAKARSQAAIKGWRTRRRKIRILTDNAYRRKVWEREKARVDTVEDFAANVVDLYGITLHDAYTLNYSPELAA